MSDTAITKAAEEAGGRLIMARLAVPEGRNGGCGAPTRVAGTNGGWMSCGSLLTELGKTAPYYCGACYMEMKEREATRMRDKTEKFLFDALDRLIRAAENRDNTMGDQITYLNAKIELAEAVSNARIALGLIHDGASVNETVVGLQPDKTRKPFDESAWTDEFFGISHLHRPGDKRWASVVRDGPSATLKAWYDGCGFTPHERSFSSTEAAKRAGEHWVTSGILPGFYEDHGYDQT